MKQHITRDQWNQISPEQQNCFVGSLQTGESEYMGDGVCSECGKSGLPTVGQIIEFLTKSDCYSDTVWIDVGGLDHRVQGQVERAGEPLVALGWTGPELIDPLWKEAVRVLELYDQA